MSRAQNRLGLLANIVGLKKKFYDPMAPFRDMAIGGKLDNGPETIRDPRSKNVTILLEQDYG